MTAWAFRPLVESNIDLAWPLIETLVAAAARRPSSARR